MPICRYLKMHLAETFPMPPSDPFQPSAFAVGMRRNVAKNRSAAYATRTSPATGRAMDENEQDYWGTITQIDAQVSCGPI